MRTFLLLAASAALLSAQGDPPFLTEPGWQPLLNGRDLTGWQAKDPAKPHEWFTTRAVRYDPAGAPAKLVAQPAPGDRIVNGPQGKTQDWVTTATHGDVELYLEWMVPKGSNSGVYLHGLYEVQVFDSFGKAKVEYSDAGGIYHRWINNAGVGGSAPRINMARAPGEWQSFHIWFRAPRFDAAGKKTENARFLRVIHNGVVVQENFEADGPTRAHMNLAEAPRNPLMLQGDHGPVAYRNIYWRPLGASPKP
jgi:hypothetical protein